MWGAPRHRVIGGTVVALLLLACLSIMPGAALARARPLVPDNPIGMNPMLYLSTPFGAEQAMMSQAAAGGASMVRLEIELMVVFPNPNGQPDWSALSHYV